MKPRLPRNERLALLAMALMDLQRAQGHVVRADCYQLSRTIAGALRHAQRTYWYLNSPTRQKGRKDGVQDPQ